MNPRYYRLLVFICLITLCNYSTAQDTVADNNSPAANSDQLITLNMREAEIVSVIQWMAEQTQKKIIIDPRVSGKVSILANVPMSLEQAYHVFLAMLNVYGYAAVESGGIVRIIPSAAAKTTAGSVISNFQNNQGSQQALYVYQSQALNSEKLQNALRPLVSSSGHLSAIPGSNKLIIADAYDNIHRLVALIQQLDQDQELQIQTLKLQYASANTVAAVINSLIASDNNSSFTIASDQRSNSILMTGDPLIEKRVKQLIAQLDKPISSTDNTKVIYLHYTDADEMLPILQNMAKALATDNKNHNIQGQTINVAASATTNALIVTAPPDILYAMEKVVAQIDIRRAQVLVEAIIVEVSEDVSQRLGVEWNTSFDAGTGTEAATSFGLKQLNISTGEVLLSGGLSVGYYSGGSLRALINALASEVDANILSTPSLVTLDNQEAEVLVGSNVPFITGQALTNNNTSDNPFTTIERQDIGLSLKVTPQINNGNTVTLDIVQELETISDSSSAATDIVTNKRSIKTKVQVQNDGILVLGGLISDEQTERVDKVPLLGDLPILGALFTSTSTQTLQRNLMIFIHPKILANDIESEALSGEKYQQMQDLREQYKR
ncbi:type II secretion system secretin GspD [Dasania sp. GY-MA-18]|uniref:Type II secretion system secretin GspD n=1 Tax=Dasania phycosphaerae TaxID=2950436 RepID=A0A9J6RIE6_9GAMM|nr:MULTISPECIES: type II secretion system secretin GspD [Dasania]MCR8921807.1 type II secretion system secretin GspD [Dasania sp. GY-MA-18]MCZ0864235.1 type II secretion system secretin GspD [Dasania phycosphaerae]MCZ0867963.1 type II secretion system secretin GspD [Dasania phycosphaerae]